MFVFSSGRGADDRDMVTHLARDMQRVSVTRVLVTLCIMSFRALSAQLYLAVEGLSGLIEKTLSNGRDIQINQSLMESIDQSGQNITRDRLKTKAVSIFNPKSRHLPVPTVQRFLGKPKRPLNCTRNLPVLPSPLFLIHRSRSVSTFSLPLQPCSQ